ncbi:MAG: RHS repeat-associated core domain-containing protein [Anaerolineae bacterium]|nr:RHS repeat-associated core domain-containing protein [Anaerolineae bacterium]
MSYTAAWHIPTVVTRFDYGPYGSEQQRSGSLLPERGYAGMYRHAPTGLYLTHYRAYSPATGRWLTRDPIFEAGGINLYAYVEGNPISRIDPFGLYGTPSCAYYSQACKRSGGYACAAQYICPVFPEGEENAWWQCVRQCLQEEHNRREESENSCYVTDNPYTDHTTCLTACSINSGNPGMPHGTPPRP